MKSRVSTSLEVKRSYREKAAEMWGGIGDYSNIPFFRDQSNTSEEFVPGEQSISVEKEIPKLITRILEIKAEKGDDKPVIVADFGGMYGISFLHIASSMKDLVESGRVAFVVTNLAFTLEYGLSVEGNSTHRFTPEQIKFIKENRNLVNYVTADATELKRRSIQILGKEYPLNGNIDLLHETTTITHTLKPDIDIPRLGKILSPYGIFLL